MALAVVVVVDQRGLRALDRGDDVGERDLAPVCARARSRRRRRASSARARRPSPTAGSARGRAAAGRCARRSPSPRSVVPRRGARATATPGPRSRCGSRPSPHHRREPGPGTARRTRIGARSLRRAMPSPRDRMRRCCPRSTVPSVAGLDPGARRAATGAVAARRRSREPRSVVLLVLDGLGANEVDEPRRRSCASSPRWRADAITTVVPSTTSTALTSIATGLAPAQHGILGYRMLVDDEVLNVLRWQYGVAAPARSVRRAAPQRVPRTPGAGRHPAASSATSGFSQAHLRGSTFVGWKTHRDARRALPATRRSRASGSCTRTTRASTRSRTSTGCTTASTRASSRRPTRSSARCSTCFPPDAALLVTADHGQVHLERRVVDRDRRAAPDDRDAGGRRALPLPVRAQGHGAASSLAAAHARLDDVAWVVSRRELLDAGWLGTGATGTVPGPHRRRRARGARAGRLRRSRAAARAQPAVGPRQPHRRRDVRAPASRPGPRPDTFDVGRERRVGSRMTRM